MAPSGNPQLPRNVNIPLPPSIMVTPEVVTVWPIIDGSTYEITMNVNDPFDQEGSQSDLTSGIGLFYCTDTPFTVGDQRKWQNYSDYYNNQGPAETINFYQMYGSLLYGFALLPLIINDSNPNEIIIGSNFGCKNLDGSFSNAGSVTIDSPGSGYDPLSMLKSGITIYTKCIDEHKSYRPSLTYIHKIVGPTTLNFDLEKYVYCHVLVGDTMYVYTEADSNMGISFNIKNNDSLLLFAALGAPKDRHFQVGDPRVDAAMSCTRITRS